MQDLQLWQRHFSPFVRMSHVFSFSCAPALRKDRFLSSFAPSVSTSTEALEKLFAVYEDFFSHNQAPLLAHLASLGQTCFSHVDCTSSLPPTLGPYNPSPGRARATLLKDSGPVTLPDPMKHVFSSRWACGDPP